MALDQLGARGQTERGPGVQLLDDGVPGGEAPGLLAEQAGRRRRRRRARRPRRRSTPSAAASCGGGRRARGRRELAGDGEQRERRAVEPLQRGLHRRAVEQRLGEVEEVADAVLRGRRARVTRRARASSSSARSRAASARAEPLLAGIARETARGARCCMTRNDDEQRRATIGSPMSGQHGDRRPGAAGEVDAARAADEDRATIAMIERPTMDRDHRTRGCVRYD